MGCAAAVSGDVTVNVDTVMCNCAAPNNENYVRMHEAHVECGAYPEGAAGHASCITNTLGFLSVDGRSADVAGLTGMFGDAAANFDSANLDAVLGNFLECAQAAAIMTCEDNLRTSL